MEKVVGGVNLLHEDFLLILLIKIYDIEGSVRFI